MYEADRVLVSRMRAGEQRAFDEFFNASASRLAAFVSRRSGLDPASVEDIVQNTLIKAVRNLASYRGEAALFTWVTEICRHELADARRKAARRPAHDSLDEPDAVAFPVPQLWVPEHREPAAEADAHDRRKAVVQALNDLPERYARALEAKYGDGLSVKEVAALFGLTTVAAQSLLARARDAFRERWNGESDVVVGVRRDD
ncbi:MAG TPA: sigma-70 family RNA polymerase sigma factor [Solirubrobacteraceae bacterium]